MPKFCGEFGAVSADEFSGPAEEMLAAATRDFRLVLYERPISPPVVKTIVGSGPLPPFVALAYIATEDSEHEPVLTEDDLLIFVE